MTGQQGDSAGGAKPGRGQAHRGRAGPGGSGGAIYTDGTGYDLSVTGTVMREQHRP